MTQRLFVALLTVIVFMAGYSARMWTDRGARVQPPPEAFAREYTPQSGSANQKKPEPLDRAKIVAEIEKLRPQIEAYVAQVQEIENEFEREFVLILTPAQKDKYAANQKKFAEDRAKHLVKSTPLSDEEIRSARERPLTNIYFKITVTSALNGLTKEFGLDAAQQASTRTLLSQKRNKYISLFDATPHPSIRLSRLLDSLQRVSPSEKAMESLVPAKPAGK